MVDTLVFHYIQQSEGLLTAAESGDTDTVKRLIALGADVEFCNEVRIV